MRRYLASTKGRYYKNMKKRKGGLTALVGWTRSHGRANGEAGAVATAAQFGGGTGVLRGVSCLVINTADVFGQQPGGLALAVATPEAIATFRLRDAPAFHMKG